MHSRSTTRKSSFNNRDFRWHFKEICWYDKVPTELLPTLFVGVNVVGKSLPTDLVSLLEIPTEYQQIANTLQE